LTTSHIVTTRSVEETMHIARALGSLLKPGMIITLEGDLGAGKTHFTQGLARGLGVQGIVNSPTFSLIKEYQGASLELYHMDLYRIDPDEAEELGLEEYFYGEGVCVIEWAGRIHEMLSKERLDIHLRIKGENEREIHFVAMGTDYMLLVTKWRELLKEELKR
jgi:tRNA threonylcarbamoyladenosine biosynthesis protein TsaE